MRYKRLSTDIPVAQSLCDEIDGQLRDARHRLSDRIQVGFIAASWLFTCAIAFTAKAEATALVTIGGILAAISMLLAWLRPGLPGGRHLYGAIQMCFSTMLLALGSAHADAELHMFASLISLAFYGDWRVVASATIAAVAGHVLAGANAEQLVHFFSFSLLLNAILIAFCVVGRKEMRESARREARLVRMKAIVERKVEERTIALQESSERYRSLVENSAVASLELDRHTLVLSYVAPQSARFLECTPEEIRDSRFVLRCIQQGDRQRLQRLLRELARDTGHAADPIDFRVTTKTGREIDARMFVSVGIRKIHVCCVDVTRQKKLELELQHAQKLESIGRLAAGVAHEMNTPLQYAGDSVSFAADAIAEVMAVVRMQSTVVDAALARDASDPTAVRAHEASDRADLPYLGDELPNALNRAREGITRVAAIVKSMKQFAHPGGEVQVADLNQAMRSTLIIARNEYRYVADVDVELEDDLPSVECRLGEINQVFLAILVNAAHAIADTSASLNTRGTIRVRSRVDEDIVEFAIQDSGPGILETVRERIFEPFFTTKAVGRGSGQGLAIAKSIVDQHGGSLSFDTVADKGTTFFVRLPLVQRSRVEESRAA